MREAAVKTRHFSNDVTELGRVSEWIHACFANEGLQDGLLHRLDLCIHEAVANVIRYGYPPAARGTIAISLEGTQGAIEATVIDDGRAFDPLAHPPPPTAVSIDDLPVGGFGIHLIRSLSDGLEYRRESGRNLLLMRFRDRGSE